MQAEQFAPKLLQWFEKYGRHDLPWHHPRTVYHVWVSEIMLQQTQVVTVIEYYQRFIKRFPNIAKLASASQDEVIQHWAGLGYYSRARNLHKTALHIHGQCKGQWPTTTEELMKLPGIGKSTAAAIIAQAYNQRAVILDGNVKRVLCRLFDVAGWPGEKSVEAKLWTLAERLTPQNRACDYTQAIMDFGATYCKRSQPVCTDCVFQKTCQAYLNDTVKELPQKKPKQVKPIKQKIFAIKQDSNYQINLIKRPDSGIWGGMYSLPEFDHINELTSDVTKNNKTIELKKLPAIQHSFTHFHLDMQTYLLTNITRTETEDEYSSWHDYDKALELGLPAPIKKILLSQKENLKKQEITL